jgi:hypothetical protein
MRLTAFLAARRDIVLAEQAATYKGTGLPRPPRADPGVRLSRTGLLPKVERDRGSGLWRPMHPRSAGLRLRLHATSGTESGACVAARLPPAGRLPSTISATDCGRLCSRLPWYYAAVRLLTSPATASPPRLPVVARPRRSGLGEARSPKFRRFPSIRNGVSDLGRAVAPCITVHNVLPSTVTTVSASARLSISRLNIPLRMIAVYASQPSSPATTQHSLGGGSLLPYPRRTSTGWKAPASLGAL